MTSMKRDRLKTSFSTPLKRARHPYVIRLFLFTYNSNFRSKLQAIVFLFDFRQYSPLPISARARTRKGGKRFYFV